MKTSENQEMVGAFSSAMYQDGLIHALEYIIAGSMTGKTMKDFSEELNHHEKTLDKYWREIEGHPLSQIKKRQDETNPLFRLIRQHGLAREFPLIIATIKAFSHGKIKITEDKKVIDADGKAIMGYDMTNEINELVKEAISYQTL